MDDKKTKSPLRVGELPSMVTPTNSIPTAADENKELQREVDALAALPILKYERTYRDTAKRLGMRAAILDSAV